MSFLPGTSQQYSHTDNVLLGRVIQQATGQSMKELYDKNIFRPMGMKDTQFPGDQEIQSPVLHAFTRDRKLHLLEPLLGFDAGTANFQPARPGKMGPDFGNRSSNLAGTLPGAACPYFGG